MLLAITACLVLYSFSPLKLQAFNLSFSSSPSEIIIITTSLPQWARILQVRTDSLNANYPGTKGTSHKSNRSGSDSSPLMDVITATRQDPISKCLLS